jgi:alpha-glucosidase
MSNDLRWWQTGIIYQVYPRSFQDSNGDGIGDLAGITSRLDHLQWLGVNAVWISPFFRSPMADFGYDVSDYCDVEPMFGTLAEFDRLVDEAHRRDLRVILDFVPNHTSEEHPWFVESRSSRDNSKRDWYIWCDAKPDGSPPNNWVSHFGGGAWEWDETTSQYYLHSFLEEQPDLNWRNPDVIEAMLDVLRFWLKRGVDGFRVDVMWETVKDELLRDNPPNPNYIEGKTNPYFRVLPLYNHDQPDVHDVVRKMRAVLDEYGDKVLIGEIYLPVDRLVTYYGENGDGCHLPYNFQLVLLPWDARRIAAAIDRYEASLPPFGWPNWVLGNHDRSRVATRAGREQAGVAATLLFTLRGTPTLYYGDELGMEDVPIPDDRLQDPVERNVPGLGIGRDPERTPMQWDTSPNAGFTTADHPWLPLAPDYREYSVECERQDPGSLLMLHKRLIELRQSEPALIAGTFRPVPAEGDLLAFERDKDGIRFLVALNFGSSEVTLPLDERTGNIALSTLLDREGESWSGELELRANEGVVARMDDLGRH